MRNTFGAKVLEHFHTDEQLQPGQAAAQVGVLMLHFRRITTTQEKLDSATAILGRDLRQDFQNIFEFCKGPSSKSPLKTKRTLKASLSEVSVDSIGFPKIPDSPGLKMDDYGFPLTPSPGKPKAASSSKVPHHDYTIQDVEALGCVPPPVDKKEWHAVKKPAAAPAMLHAPPGHKAHKKPSKTHTGGTGDFVINGGTVKVGGGKNQTYLQHRPNPSAGLQLICSVLQKEIAEACKEAAG